MEDRRFADRYQELAARRQLEMEHTRREQEMARRMQEVREREARYGCSTTNSGGHILLSSFILTV